MALAHYGFIWFLKTILTSTKERFSNYETGLLWSFVAALSSLGHFQTLVPGLPEIGEDNEIVYKITLIWMRFLSFSLLFHRKRDQMNEAVFYFYEINYTGVN